MYFFIARKMLNVKMGYHMITEKSNKVKISTFKITFEYVEKFDAMRSPEDPSMRNLAK